MHEPEIKVNEQPVAQQIIELKRRLQELEEIPLDEKVPVLIDSVLAAQQVAEAKREAKRDTRSPELDIKSSSWPGIPFESAVCAQCHMH